MFVSNVAGQCPYPAILNAMIKSSLHPQINFDPSVDSVMTTINQTIRYLANVQACITCCYILIDAEMCKLEFINAGCPSILLYRSESRQIVELESTFDSLSLSSINNDVVCHGEEMSWQPHDILILSPNAITERKSLNGKPYGINRLRKTIIASADLSPLEIQRRVLSDLNTHTMGASSDSDVIIVVIKAN